MFSWRHDRSRFDPPQHLLVPREELAELWADVGSHLAPNADTAQSRPQRPIHTCLDVNVRIVRRRYRLLLLRRLRVPQIDVQTFDLFDQQENCLSGGAKIGIAVR